MQKQIQIAIIPKIIQKSNILVCFIILFIFAFLAVTIKNFLFSSIHTFLYFILFFRYRLPILSPKHACSETQLTFVHSIFKVKRKNCMRAVNLTFLYDISG